MNDLSRLYGGVINYTRKEAYREVTFLQNTKSIDYCDERPGFIYNAQYNKTALFTGYNIHFGGDYSW